MNEDVRKDLDSPEELDENEVVIERMVPISNVEILGLSVKKDDSAILLELGYIKNEKSGDIVIDVRKEIPLKMAKDLYIRLEKILENSDSAD